MKYEVFHIAIDDIQEQLNGWIAEHKPQKIQETIIGPGMSTKTAVVIIRYD